MKKISIALIVVMIFMSGILASNTGTAYAESESALTVEGDYAYIGEYPQTLETDKTILDALEAVVQGDDGYYTYNGERYAKSVAEIYTYEGGGTYSDGSTPVSGEIKYFKVEPIKWRIINKSEDGDMLMLISDCVLDTHAWQTQYTGNTDTTDCVITITDDNGQEQQIPANDWQYSEIRAWLNTNFYDIAFDTAARSSVLKVTTPSSKTTSNVDTEDFVGLLCESDYTPLRETLKDCGASDYAKAQGLYYNFHNYKYPIYYLNTIASETIYGIVKNIRGGDVQNYARLNIDDYGVRPIIYVGIDETENVSTDKENNGQNKADLYKILEIAGIIIAAVGVSVVVPLAVSGSKKQKKAKKENGADYKPKKWQTALFAVSFTMLVAGLGMLIIPTAINGKFGGVASPDGIYVQTSGFDNDDSDGMVQEGAVAFKFESDGTCYYTSYYDGDDTGWELSGTWTQSGSKVSFVFTGDWGFSNTYTINSSGTQLSYNGYCFTKID